MSDIVFHCVKCGAKLSAEPAEAGEEFECPVCRNVQIVPGGIQSQTSTKAELISTPTGGTEPPPATKVVRIPKKKIVLSSADEADEEDLEEEIEEEIDDQVRGSGLRVFAVMIGTAGVVLCIMSVIFALMAQGSQDREWWIMILTFVSTFLLALMGLVLALLAFRIERIAARLQLIMSGE